MFSPVRYRMLACALLLLLLTACGRSADRPPDDGTPWPENLTGVFVLGDSSLTFNGDGKSVTLDLDPELAGRMGLPAGKSEGGYAFLFRNESWRYDLAEALRITVGDTSQRYTTVPGSTDGGMLSFCLPDDGEQIRFVKED